MVWTPSTIPLGFRLFASLLFCLCFLIVRYAQTPHMCLVCGVEN